jgi:two-component system nitrate/nitrite sensor histidine kinase NarX
MEAELCHLRAGEVAHGVEEWTEDRAADQLEREDAHPTRVLCQVTAIVSQAPEVSRALDAVLDQLLALTKAEIGAVYLVDRVSGDLDLAATRGLSQAFRALECRIPKGACLCGLFATLDEPLVVDDLAQDSRLSRTACREERLGAMVGVPLRSRGETRGILTLYASRAGAFEAIDRSVLRAIGWQLGLAIDNALWAVAMREAAVANERSAMASELHDGVAQSLAYLHLQTRRVHDLLSRGANELAQRELDGASEAIDVAYRDVRRLLIDFRTARKRDEPLAASLRAALDVFQRSTRIQTELIGERDVDRLSVGHKSELLRMVQEALANVRKHARASRVVVTCRWTPERWELAVADDGAGCDPARFDDATGAHLGATLLRERAARVGGQVRFLSHPGEGTTIIITVPLAPTHEGSAT